MSRGAVRAGRVILAVVAVPWIGLAALMAVLLRYCS